jgi:hypothetical protein
MTACFTVNIINLIFFKHLVVSEIAFNSLKIKRDLYEV